MLEPRRREALAELLEPPLGMVFDAGVVTTYTLDLDALLLGAICLAGHDLVGDVGDVDVPRLVDSCESVGRRLHAVYQSGLLKAPQWNEAFTFLESNVHAATARVDGAIFHPKLWIVRFRSEVEPSKSLLRVVVATRNVGFDRSWDLAVTLEGSPSTSAKPGPGGGVATLLDAIPKLAVKQDASLRSTCASLAADARRTRLEGPAGVDARKLHVIGLGPVPKVLPQMATSSLVIAPFVEAGWARAWPTHFRSGGRHAIIARGAQLDQLPDDARAVWSHLRVLDPDLASGIPSDAPEGGQFVRERDLHAKLYVIEPDGRQRPIWLLGSANATNAGWRSNIEVLLEMHARERRGYDIYSLIHEEARGGEPGFVDLLEPWTEAQPTDDELERQAAQKRIDIALSQLRPGQIVVSAVADGNWQADVSLPYRGGVDGLTFRVGLATIPAATWRSVTPHDGHLRSGTPTLSDQGVCAYATVEVADVATGLTERAAVVCEVIGGPPNRRDNTLARMFESAADIERYLRLLLGVDPEIEGEGQAGWLSLTSSNGRSEAPQPAILELLLATLVRHPGRLRRFDVLLEALDRAGANCVPPELVELWACVTAAVPKGKR